LNKMQIRKATKDDAEGVAKVLLELLNISGVEEGKRTFLNEISKGHRYIVVEENGKIMGTISWLMHGRPVHGLVELYHIVVSSKSRGKGVGKKLFDALIKDAKEEYRKNNSHLRKLFLLTRSLNPAAHAFYKKIGLKYETKLKSHFYKGKDEYVFSIFFD